MKDSSYIRESISRGNYNVPLSVIVMVCAVLVICHERSRWKLLGKYEKADNHGGAD